MFGYFYKSIFTISLKLKENTIDCLIPVFNKSS